MVEVRIVVVAVGLARVVYSLAGHTAVVRMFPTACESRSAVARQRQKVFCCLTA